MNVHRVRGTTITLVVSVVFYLCLVFRSRYYFHHEKSSLQNVSNVRENDTTLRCGYSIRYINFCQITIAATSSYVEKEAHFVKPNLTDAENDDLNFKKFVDTNGNDQQHFENTVPFTGDKIQERNSDFRSNPSRSQMAKCNTSSCVLYLYCFENKSSKNIQCFDIRMKHSIEKSDLGEELVDYGRFLKTHQTNWQKEYVVNYQLLSGSNLNTSSGNISNRIQIVSVHDSTPIKLSRYFLVLYCSPMQDSTVIQCFDIKMTNKGRFSYQRKVPAQEKIPVSRNCQHKSDGENYEEERDENHTNHFGLCFKTQYGNIFLSRSAQSLLRTNENQIYQHGHCSTSGCLSEKGSEWFEIMLYLCIFIVVVGGLGNAVIIRTQRKSRKETVVIKDWDTIQEETKQKLEEALQYRKDMAERQRQRREEMALENERRGYATILGFIRSLAFPLIKEARDFNNWVESPD